MLFRSPSAGNLTNGELAFNLVDKKLYALDSLGVVTLIASAAGASGSVTSVSGSGGTTGLTLSGGPITASGTLTLGGILIGANGGTGVNNGSSTITIGGNVTFSGAYTFSGTLTNNTSVTFPTSGTLSTLAGTETLTNKTIQPRVVSTATATSITINADTTDIATMANTQGAGTFTLNAPSGTPYNGQKIIFRLSSTSVQTFSWNAIFQGSTDLSLPTASSSGGDRKSTRLNSSHIPLSRMPSSA